MNQDAFLQQISEESQLFRPITLREMDSVKLMDRVDVKYLIPLNFLPKVLGDALPFYRILEVNQTRICPYETLYYDTEKLDLYHTHQTGRTNRYKIRFRNYVGSNLSFFEIKFKNNKGRTIKTRIKQPNSFNYQLNSEQSDFLENSTPIEAQTLKGNLWVNYNRMTLVNNTSAERLTIDIQLNFHTQTQTADYSQVAIAEVKQERIGASPIIDILKKYELKEGSISKYCLGIISTNDDVKHNRFKPNLIRLKKLLEN